jgi:hypothetical protein
MQRRKLQVTAAVFFFLGLLIPSASWGQEERTGEQNGALRVYLECATWGCDSRHFRTEITFVNWVREVQDAQLHVIMTSQDAGSGQEYLLDFLGREELEGSEEQLTYFHPNTDTDDERTQGLTGVLAVGLARASIAAGFQGPYTVMTKTPSEAEVPDLPPGLQGEVDDPWDYWVFRIGGNTDMSAESRQEEYSFSGNLSADRTTEKWKIDLGAYGRFSSREVELADTTKTFNRESWSVNGRVAYSLAERWSAGVEAGGSSSTSNNQEIGGRLGAGLEYSFFPYRDWTRRRMTLQLITFVQYYDYEEETVFGKLTETIPEASLNWNLGFRQPWGNARVGASAEAFLNDFEKNSFRVGGRLSFRIVRGLEWNLSGDYERIRNQIYLSAGGITDEEILIELRDLPTDYEFSIRTGLSFTFGSIYNNIVNNRFGDLHGGGRGRF